MRDADYGYSIVGAGPARCVFANCLIEILDGSGGDEDQLAARKCSLAHPGLGGSREWHRFSFNRAAASSRVRENFVESQRLLLR